jgi:hypothetical protein
MKWPHIHVPDKVKCDKDDVLNLFVITTIVFVCGNVFVW